jgi:hypothetical protein
MWVLREHIADVPSAAATGSKGTLMAPMSKTRPEEVGTVAPRSIIPNTMGIATILLRLVETHLFRPWPDETSLTRAITTAIVVAVV